MKIQFVLCDTWFDGSGYKFPEYLKSEFGIEYVRGEFDDNLDLGICRGMKHKTYKKFIGKGIPYLLIEHDIESMRLGMDNKLYKHEKEKIENANAVIFTSEDHAEYYEFMKKIYGWKLPEYIVIHNRPLKKDIDFKPLPKLEGLHLVYAGGVMEHWGQRDMTYGNYNHKAYHHIFKQFIKAGWKVHLYPTKLASRRSYKEYTDMGVEVHKWVNGDQIYREMSQYTAGLNAFNEIQTPEMALRYAQSTRPNKTYDYLASGIPTIGYQGGKCMEIYKDKWGIVIEDLEQETLKIIPERLKKINITKELKEENVLDNEKEKFEYIINKAMISNKHNILYTISKYETGSAYKHVQFMKKYFGGAVVRDRKSEALEYLNKVRPKFMVCRGDNRRDYQLALQFKIPYILIENDVSTMRTPNDSNREKEQIENASAIIFSSEDHIEYCKERYNLPYHVLIYNRPQKSDIEFKPKEKLPGLNLVYAGGMATTKSSNMGKYGYRAYHDIFKAFIEAGWNVHLYPSINNSTFAGYRSLGCIVHDKLPYNKLLREMSQYTAGLHTYNKNGVPEEAFNYSQNCRGNKIWDFLGAGIPTIGYQGGKGMDIYRNKWGIVIRSLSKKTLQNIPKRLEKIKITNEMRYENVIDNDLDKFRNVIEVALEKKRALDKLPKVEMPKVIKWNESDIVIQVANRTPRPIERGNHIFAPYKTTEPFIVNKVQWKEIKSNVGLRILYIQEGNHVSSESPEQNTGQSKQRSTCLSTGNIDLQN